MRMPFDLPRFLSSTALPKIFRQIEHEVDTVINVLQPGPLGIIEHKFSSSELLDAKARVARAVDKWTRYKDMEKQCYNFKNDVKRATADEF